MKKIDALKGIYLVIDPSMEEKKLMTKLEAALRGGINLVQIWNNWPKNGTFEAKTERISAIKTLVEPYQIPILINEDWQLLHEIPLDGVHFDAIPLDIDFIRKEIGRPVVMGLTCSNDLENIRWAAQNRLDYISFCAVFPSSSVISCEIVKPESIRRARELTDMPIFLSGGIRQDNLVRLQDYKIQGIALISGIMDAQSPEITVKEYKTQLNALHL